MKYKRVYKVFSGEKKKNDFKNTLHTHNHFEKQLFKGKNGKTWKESSYRKTKRCFSFHFDDKHVRNKVKKEENNKSND